MIRRDKSVSSDFSAEISSDIRKKKSVLSVFTISSDFSAEVSFDTAREIGFERFFRGNKFGCPEKEDSFGHFLGFEWPFPRK